MILRSFLVHVAYVTAFLFSPICMASSALSQFEDVKDLRAKIDVHAKQYFESIYGSEKFSRDVRLRVSNLDPRLKLAKCEDPIKFDIIRPAHRSRNVTVKTTCESVKRWSIYVPLTIEIYDDVVVAARALTRGTIIETEDLQTRRINTASLPLGHVVDYTRLIGMELKRSTRNGSYLLLSSVEPPRVINKGDAVVLEARHSALSVATKGTALNNGQVGEQIKVRNNRSDRVVDAMVTGPGRVTVVSR